MKQTKYKQPGDFFNAAKNIISKGANAIVPKATKIVPVAKTAPKIEPSKTSRPVKNFKPYYGGVGGKMSNGSGWGGEKKKTKKVIKKKGKKGKGKIKKIKK